MGVFFSFLNKEQAPIDLPQLDVLRTSPGEEDYYKIVKINVDGDDWAWTYEFYDSIPMLKLIKYNGSRQIRSGCGNPWNIAIAIGPEYHSKILATRPPEMKLSANNTDKPEIKIDVYYTVEDAMKHISDAIGNDSASVFATTRKREPIELFYVYDDEELNFPIAEEDRKTDDEIGAIRDTLEKDPSPIIEQLHRGNLIHFVYNFWFIDEVMMYDERTKSYIVTSVSYNHM